MKKTMYINLAFFLVLVFGGRLEAQASPHEYMDKKSQEMVQVIISNSELFNQDPNIFKQKIKDIFEPMIDFRRVGAMVMGKTHYRNSSDDQRIAFIEVFKNSLLDSYAETLSQWGDQKIETIWPEDDPKEYSVVVDVNQRLITDSNIYPIVYKVRNNGSSGWQIVNIVINGINLGLTFRNQFQALASENNNDINKVISNWSSDIEV